MKTIITTQGTDPNIQQPFTAPSLKFLQDSSVEIAAALFQGALTAAYDPTKVYILFGCIDSTPGGGTRTISAGWVFYNGVLYQVDAVTFTPGGGQTAVATIVVTNPSPDPILFKNGSSHNVHNVSKVVIGSAVAGSGISDFANFISTKKVVLEAGNASYTINSTVFTNVTDLTITTPNDGITRNYLLLFKAFLINSNGNITSDADIQFYNTTDSVVYDSTTGGKAEGTLSHVYVIGANLLDYQTIGPNKTITIQARYGSGGANITLDKAKMKLIEIR